MKPNPAIADLLNPPPILRSEAVVVVVLVLVGACLRCWQPGHMAVEHFDEGVYASNLYCPPSGSYPFRHLYAPPLLPGLLELALILGGGAAGSVMAVNIVAGCGMIPSLWWIGRQWFGPVAGITAAALAAFSQMHILYSRTALTDGLLCLWMLWGVYWAWRGILTGRPAAILLAGIFASLAWWTKYNGWLTLAISGSGTIAWLVARGLQRLRRTPDREGEAPSHGRIDRTLQSPSTGHTSRTEPRTAAALLRWGMITIIAALGWLPFFLSLEDHGGYAAVSANHAKYFVGVAGWWDGLARQRANLDFINHAGGSFALVLVALTLVSGHRRTVSYGRLAAAELIVVLAVIVALNLVAPVTVVVLLSAAGILWGLVCHHLSPGNDSTRQALWMLAAWFLGLLVAIPLYAPYPRLSLPFLVVSWLGAGLAFSFLFADKHLSAHPDDWKRPRWQIGLSGVVLIAAGTTLVIQDQIGHQDRSALRTIASEILAQVPDDRPTVMMVLGEPALFFHLANQSRSQKLAIIPGGEFASLSPPDPSLGPIEMYVAFGQRAVRDTRDPTAGISWAEASLERIDQWNYQPSRLVLLNDLSPEAIETDDLVPHVIALGRIGP